jgi:phage gp45-like
MSLLDLNRRLNSLFGRGVLRHADVQLGLMTGQAEFLAGEVRRVEVPQGYGFASQPFAGSELFAAFAGGERSAGVALAFDDRRRRPTNLREGEVMVYGKGVRDDIGHGIRFTDQPKANSVVLKARRFELRAGDHYLIIDADEGLHASGAIGTP